MIPSFCSMLDSADIAAAIARITGGLISGTIGTCILLGYLVVAGFAMRAMFAWRDDARMWSIETGDQVPTWAVLLLPIAWLPLLIVLVLIRAAWLLIEAVRR